jgi:hypothetical protein
MSTYEATYVLRVVAGRANGLDGAAALAERLAIMHELVKTL